MPAVYVSPDRKLVAVPVKPGPALEFGAPAVLFDIPISGALTTAVLRHEYDVSPDGRFLVAALAGTRHVFEITVVLNWAAGLRQWKER